MWVTVGALFADSQAPGFQKSGAVEKQVSERTEEASEAGVQLREVADRRAEIALNSRRSKLGCVLALQAGKMGTWDWDIERAS